MLLQEKQSFNSIDISYLSKGLLFVAIDTIDGVLTYKIVKE